jgi:FG-GAP repeat
MKNEASVLAALVLAAAPVAGIDRPLSPKGPRTGHDSAGPAAAAPAAPGAELGYAVALSGHTLVAGAPFGDGASPGSGSGAAYVYARAGDGSWVLQARLVAPDGALADRFGYSVSISGDTVLVGAPYHDPAAGSNAGAAYVFERSGGTWTLQQELTASDAASGDGFGYGVTVSGDLLAVGAVFDDTAGGADAGSAYVFARAGGTWVEEQKLVAPDARPVDYMTYRLSLSGDTLVAGGDGIDTTAGTNAGAAYVFVRSGNGTWSLQQKLTAPDGAAFDYFANVSISGDTIVVGADGAGPGAAYVFVRAGGGWTLQQKLVPSDGAGIDSFSWWTSLSGNTVVFGSPWANLPNAPVAGAAYVFVRQGDVWLQHQKLTASDAGANDYLGWCVAASGRTVVAGAPLHDTPITNEGAGYAFTRFGLSWSQWPALTVRTTPGANEP